MRRCLGPDVPDVCTWILPYFFRCLPAQQIAFPQWIYPHRAVLQSLLCANASYVVHPNIPSPFPVACTTSRRDRDVPASKLPANNTRISVAPRVDTNSAPRPWIQRFNASTSKRILVCKAHIERRINASISYGTGKGIARHARRWPAILRVRFSESGRLSKRAFRYEDIMLAKEN
jgi:hypothetical protein